MTGKELESELKYGAGVSEARLRGGVTAGRGEDVVDG